MKRPIHREFVKTFKFNNHWYTLKNLFDNVNKFDFNKETNIIKSKLKLNLNIYGLINEKEESL